ncbi:hypothetical protein [Chitinimonas arctica]|nr:hypothetical protein [Chitinimonas arctica]
MVFQLSEGASPDPTVDLPFAPHVIRMRERNAAIAARKRSQLSFTFDDDPSGDVAAVA